MKSFSTQNLCRRFKSCRFKWIDYVTIAPKLVVIPRLQNGKPMLLMQLKWSSTCPSVGSGEETRSTKPEQSRRRSETHLRLGNSTESVEAAGRQVSLVKVEASR